MKLSEAMLFIQRIAVCEFIQHISSNIHSAAISTDDIYKYLTKSKYANTDILQHHKIFLLAKRYMRKFGVFNAICSRHKMSGTALISSFVPLFNNLDTKKELLNVFDKMEMDVLDTAIANSIMNFGTGVNSSVPLKDACLANMEAGLNPSTYKFITFLSSLEDDTHYPTSNYIAAQINIRDIMMLEAKERACFPNAIVVNLSSYRKEIVKLVKGVHYELTNSKSYYIQGDPMKFAMINQYYHGDTSRRCPLCRVDNKKRPFISVPLFYRQHLNSYLNVCPTCALNFTKTTGKYTPIKTSSNRLSYAEIQKQSSEDKEKHTTIKIAYSEDFSIMKSKLRHILGLDNNTRLQISRLLGNAIDEFYQKKKDVYLPIKAKNCIKSSYCQVCGVNVIHTTSSVIHPSKHGEIVSNLAVALASITGETSLHDIGTVLKDLTKSVTPELRKKYDESNKKLEEVCEACVSTLRNKHGFCPKCNMIGLEGKKGIIITGESGGCKRVSLSKICSNCITSNKGDNLIDLTKVEGSKITDFVTNLSSLSLGCETKRYVLQPIKHEKGSQKNSNETTYLLSGNSEDYRITALLAELSDIRLPFPVRLHGLLDSNGITFRSSPNVITVLQKEARKLLNEIAALDFVDRTVFDVGRYIGTNAFNRDNMLLIGITKWARDRAFRDVVKILRKTFEVINSEKVIIDAVKAELGMTKRQPNDPIRVNDYYTATRLNGTPSSLRGINVVVPFVEGTRIKEQIFNNLPYNVKANMFVGFKDAINDYLKFPDLENWNSEPLKQFINSGITRHYFDFLTTRSEINNDIIIYNLFVAIYNFVSYVVPITLDYTTERNRLEPASRKYVFNKCKAFVRNYVAAAPDEKTIYNHFITATGSNVNKLTDVITRNKFWSIVDDFLEDYGDEILKRTVMDVGINTITSDYKDSNILNIAYSGKYSGNVTVFIRAESDRNNTDNRLMPIYYGSRRELLLPFATYRNGKIDLSVISYANKIVVFSEEAYITNALNQQIYGSSILEGPTNSFNEYREYGTMYPIERMPDYIENLRKIWSVTRDALLGNYDNNASKLRMEDRSSLRGLMHNHEASILETLINIGNYTCVE